MSPSLLVAGGGIGGLAAALAAARRGWQPRVFEQAARLSEAGAGIQLGPNACRVLRSWSLLDGVRTHACVPRRLVARDVSSGRELASLDIGREFEARYGAPYLTIHRADLHDALAQALRGAGVVPHTGLRAVGLSQEVAGVQLSLAPVSATSACAAGAAGPSTGGDAPAVRDEWGEAAVAADGLWSTLRQQLLGDGPPLASDHVAYRSLLPMIDVPARWREPEVTAWMGPDLHVVTYPVRGGEALNVVCVVQQASAGERTGWDHPAARAAVLAALGNACTALRDLVEAAPAWGLWVLHDRPAVQSAGAMAQGRVALLGDAAHPMRPYLAQGAAMALEDAAVLGDVLGEALAPGGGRTLAAPEALARYAQLRWQRCARVQRRSLRNGGIFHASGIMRIARDAGLRGLGGRLMDVPWLYRG
ncbi:FAD-dependent monooxygenase [Ramlibacter sp. AN1015]|uniref:FAD-dependent monooxygenase n=1 Tax=Ramlibacter sp. AN1015 TaxID=3133428 RepID=UPI0030BD6365